MLTESFDEKGKKAETEKGRDTCLTFRILREEWNKDNMQIGCLDLPIVAKRLDRSTGLER